MYKIYLLFSELKKRFKEINQEEWTSATFILENTGKMNLVMKFYQN